MNLPLEPPQNLFSINSTTSRSKSNSSSSSSVQTQNKWTHQLDKRLWRAIDFLHIIIMFFSLYTAIIVAILRNELFEQCPLYAKLYLRNNATHFSTDTIDRQTIWGSVYTCEFASFTYLSVFVLSFISLWIHIVFRRVVRTERLLRLPIGLLTLIFAILVLFSTSFVTDGVIKFCLNSPNNICSSSGTPIFSQSRWKIVSLPVGGWLTTISILLNAFARGIQLFSKPKKSPEALKFLLSQLMTNRQQHKLEKETSEYGSQISRPSTDKNRLQSSRRYSLDHISNREFSPELYPYYYPPIPEYRQIKKKRSRFYRICCSCFHQKQHHHHHHSFHDSYRPFVIPEEYFHRLNHLKQNGTVSTNLCHRHSMHHPVEQQTQTDLITEEKNLNETNEIPFLGRRRSSVRFEDEIPTEQSTKIDIIPIIKKDEIKDIENNNIQRNVSFRNNEDDLWTTVTINTEQSVPVQSSHFNRLSLENLSCIDTSISNSDNGITAIHVNSTPNDVVLSEIVEKEIPSPPPPPPPSLTSTESSIKTTRHRSIINDHKSPRLLPSRSHTTSSEDDADLCNIKPVEEINAIVTDKYNYNDLSQALKSNVKRLKNTFIHVQENHSNYDRPKIIRSRLSQKSSSNSNLDNHSSDC